MKRYTLLEVSWVDSDHGSGWKLVGELRDSGSMLCKSVGYFLDETAMTLRIAQSYAAENTPDEQVNGILAIPKVAIKRKRVLK